MKAFAQRCAKRGMLPAMPEVWSVKKSVFEKQERNRNFQNADLRGVRKTEHWLRFFLLDLKNLDAPSPFFGSSVVESRRRTSTL